ncbi:hypothetical protein LCGC14_1824400 [marine sediment metagenome]|uniref:Uncharacterized protein n=1 Tax=marine sediment metagenome TaxID=412755 RepID=A0A0F9GHX8_9ZZZZ
MSTKEKVHKILASLPLRHVIADNSLDNLSLPFNNKGEKIQRNVRHTDPFSFKGFSPNVYPENGSLCTDKLITLGI